MYLTAHRVIAPRSNRQGINAFLHLHGAEGWRVTLPDIPQQDPGKLENKIIEVSPPGNEVLSYLDIVAPDDAPRSELRQGFITFVSEYQLQRQPWEAVVGRCFFRLGLVRGLVNQWRREVADLYRAVQAVDNR